MRVQITVCNVCREPGVPTTRYTLTREMGKPRRFDLCATHEATPLSQLLELDEAERKEAGGSPQQAAPRRGSSTRRNGTPIMTREEIEAAKAKS